jgi:hypothetical protein
MPANALPPLATHPSSDAMFASQQGGYQEWSTFFDDFNKGYDSTFDWTVVEDAGASAPDALADAADGWLNVGCDGDDNDEVYISSYAECWKFTTNKRVSFEARVKLTEASTDDANWIVGLSDTVAADSLVDDGAGPMASYDGAVFYKVDGTMSIYFEVSNAATQSTAVALATFTTAVVYKLGFDYDYNDGVTAKVTPWVYNETTGVLTVGTAHDLTISGLEEMHVLLGAKAGGTNEEALLVDYVRVAQERT